MTNILQIAVLLLFIVYNLHVTSCGAKKTCTEDSKPHPAGVCGNMIPKMLSLICDGEYREKGDMRKRSPITSLGLLNMDARSFLDLADDAAQSTNEDALEKSFYEKKDAAMFLQKKGNYYFSGVSCECCYHRCSFKDLAFYCKDPKKAIKAIVRSGMVM